jgi:uncharacterized delta-60 repeat protein
VYALAVQGNGRILVGGQFSTLGGQTHNCLGRLNADGTPDESFAAEVSGNVNGSVTTVYCLALQDDGHVVLGGDFTALNGVTHSNIARLDVQGNLDSNFNASAWGGSYPFVFTLGMQTNGGVVVGGTFYRLNGSIRMGLGRFASDGTLDPAFDPGSGGRAYPMALQADGKILLGGARRLDATGSPDNTFVSNLGWGDVFCMSLQSDGNILVGGQSNLRRFTNTAPAMQDGTFDGSTLVWLRGGTSPEIYDAAFERLVDGTNWVGLGHGTRIYGGWQLTGLSLPGNTTFRARGLVPVGGTSYSIGCSGSSYVEGFIGAPIITSQPTNTTSDYGTTAQFSVQVGGSGPLKYQWMQDGTNITDRWLDYFTRTNATLQLYDVRGAEATSYYVVVTNANGCATSAVARLSVRDPLVTSQPWAYPRPANPGDTVEFLVNVTGTYPYSYQWRKGGVELPGRTQASVQLTNVQPVDRGAYDVIVTNCYGSVTSAPAIVTVTLSNLPPPSIVVNDGCLGVRSNRFGFTLTGSPGSIVVVESSTNFTSWTAVATNAFGTDPLPFTDSDAANAPWRFYRARLQ